MKFTKEDIPHIEKIIENLEKEKEKYTSFSIRERIKDFIWDWHRILYKLKDQK